MANPNRGQVALTVGELELKLSFSVNALCELEDLLGQPVAKIAAGLKDPENVRLATVRALVWAALRDHHDEVTLKGAGTIASDAGVPAVMAAVGKAFSLAFPEAKENARPPKAAKAG